MLNKVNWQQLLKEKRYHTSNVFYLRAESAYCLDSMEIIKSVAFQQLPEKTHLFPLESWEHSQSSLVHSLEVSYFAKLIVHKFAERNLRQTISPTEVSQMSKTVSIAGLLYEIGLPPFGYCGEKTIRDWFKEQLPRLTYEDRNVREWLSEAQYYDLEHLTIHGQRLRTVRKLHEEPREGKLNLTYPILNCLLHFSRENPDGQHPKLDYYQSEADFFATINQELSPGSRRHPLATIVEAAADIAKVTSAIKEALDMRLIKFEDLIAYLQNYGKEASLSYEQLIYLREILERTQSLLLTHQPGDSASLLWSEDLQLMLVKAAAASFNANYSSIAKGQYEQELFIGTNVEPLLRCLEQFISERIIQHRQLAESERHGQQVIRDLLSQYVPLAISLDQQEAETTLKQAFSTKAKELSLDPLESVETSVGNQLYHRILLVIDFITNLTDSQAISQHQKVINNKEGAVERLK